MKENVTHIRLIRLAFASVTVRILPSVPCGTFHPPMKSGTYTVAERRVAYASASTRVLGRSCPKASGMRTIAALETAGKGGRATYVGSECTVSVVPRGVPAWRDPEKHDGQDMVLD